MAFKNLRKHLPKTKVDYMRYTRQGYTWRIDVAGAIYTCILQDKQKYVDGDYAVAWAHWQRFVQQLKREGLGDAKLVFDGKDNAHKAPERERRDAKAAAARERIDAAKEKDEVPADSDLSLAIRNQPVYIKGCINIAESLDFKCVVQPTEADAYAAGVDCGGKRILSISGDGDMALWSDVWIGPTSWFTGQAVMIDFTAFSTADVDEYPLVGAYLKHGKMAIILAAAFSDCDFVETGATKGIGWAKYIDAATSVTGALTPAAITNYLKENYGSVAKGDAAEVQRCWEGATAAMGSVIRGVEGASYYASDGSIKTATKKVAAASAAALAHMNGTVNSRTGAPFTAAEVELLAGLDPAELTLPSQVAQRQLDAVDELGESPTPEKARRFIISAAGSTRADGKALTNAQAIALYREYREVAAEVPFARVDRSASGGLFHKVAVSAKTGNEETIKALLKDPEIKKVKHMDLPSFLKGVLAAYEAGSFVTGEEVTRASPEWSRHLLTHFYAPLASGQKSTKAMKGAVKRATQMSEPLYHAIARSADGSRIPLSMKLRASMKKDQTAAAGAHGEQKDKLPYMTLMEVLVHETTAEDDGHELGRAWAIGRSYCTCPAGLANCEHKGTGLEVQGLYWDEDRPEPKPTHFHKKCWGKHGRKKKASVIAPLHELSAGSAASDATAFRQCRDNDAKLDYDVADRELMRKHLCPSRMAAYCELLRKKNATKQAETKQENEMSGSDTDGD